MRKQFITHFKKSFSTLALCFCCACMILTGNLSATFEDSTSPESTLQIDIPDEDSISPACPITPLNDEQDDRKDID